MQAETEAYARAEARFSQEARYASEARFVAANDDLEAERERVAQLEVRSNPQNINQIHGEIALGSMCSQTGWGRSGSGWRSWRRALE